MGVPPFPDFRLAKTPGKVEEVEAEDVGWGVAVEGRTARGGPPPVVVRRTSLVRHERQRVGMVCHRLRLASAEAVRIALLS